MRLKATNKPEDKIINLIGARIVLFIVTTFFFTIVLALLQEVLTIDYHYIVLPQWGPGIAALILSFTLYKKALNESLKIKGVTLHKILISTLFPIGLIAVSLIFYNIYLLLPLNLEKVDITFFYIVVPATLFGAVGEALGWRAFLQSSISQRFNHFTAAILVGFLWGLWHVGHYGNGIVFMMFFLIFTVSFSIILSYIIRAHAYNLFYATSFHFGANIGFYIFFRVNINDTSMIMMNAIIWLLGAILVLITDKRQHAKLIKISNIKDVNGLRI